MTALFITSGNYNKRFELSQARKKDSYKEIKTASLHQVFPE